MPPNTEFCILGVPLPFGETDRDPTGVEVEAKREETEAFEVRYGKVDMEDAIDCPSAPLVLGNLRDGVLEGSGVSKGEAFGDVMKN